MNKLFKSFLVFLLTYTQAFADSPVIWNGAWSKNLTQNGFLMSNNQVVTTDGLINYVKNGHGEVSATGWTAYNGGTTTPTTCTGGSPSETITQSTSSPLVGTGSLVLTKGATSRQGDGASYPFTIDAAYKSTPLQIKVTALGSANYAASDVGIYIYDVTNAQLITPAAVNIAAGTFTLNSFFVATTSTSYRLCVHTQSTNASAWTLQLDAVSVGPQSIAAGTPVSGPITFTPSATWTTNTTTTASYTRSGNLGTFTYKSILSGAPNASTTYGVSLPTGLTLDTSVAGYDFTNSYAQVFGMGGTKAVSQYYILSVGYETSSQKFTPLYYTINSLSVGSGIRQQNILTSVIPATYASGDWVEFSFTVPIAEWAGSANNSIQGDRAVEEFASNSSSTDADDLTATNVVYGPAGASGIMGVTNLTANRKKLVRFQSPVQQTDRLFIEFNQNGQWQPLEATSFQTGIVPFTIQGSGNYGVGLISNISGLPSTDVYVVFATRYYNDSASYGGSSTATWNGLTGAKWRVRKVSGGALTGYPIANSNQIAINSASEYSANTRLGQMQYTVGNTYNNGVTLTATGTGWTTLLSSFIPYQMADGTWRMKFLLRGNTAAGQGGAGEYSVTISGVSFSTVAIQGILAAQFSSGSASTAYAYADSTTGIIAVRYNGVSSTTHSFSGDVALSSKPTWAY